MAVEKELNCREAARLMSVAFERALSPEESAQLEFHLGECVDCQYYDEQLRFLQEAARRFSR